MHPAKTDLRYVLLAQPKHSTTLVRIGRAEHHAEGGYSFEFAKPSLDGMQRWILASTSECSTWAEFGLTAMPSTLDDLHVWHDGVIVCVGSRVPAGYCEGAADKLLLLPRPSVATLPARAHGFHTLHTATPCPIEACKAMAVPSRPLCVFHWAMLDDDERTAIWRKPDLLRTVVEKRKLLLCQDLSSSPVVAASPRVRSPRQLA